jgi:hypothetical protein
MQTDLFTPPASARGLQRRNQALAHIEQRYAGFLQAMREEARKICQRVGRVTTDDLRMIAKIRGLDEPDPHVWGAIFKETGETGCYAWRSLGRTPSTLPRNNGRLITIWSLRR